MTPTGVLISLGDPATEPGAFDVAATLVADRIFDLSPNEATARGIVTHEHAKQAVAKMLAEGSLHVTVQWT
jgi:hypothetical protein